MSRSQNIKVRNELHHTSISAEVTVIEADDNEPVEHHHYHHHRSHHRQSPRSADAASGSEMITPSMLEQQVYVQSGFVLFIERTKRLSFTQVATFHPKSPSYHDSGRYSCCW